jgi:ABC-type transporter Mla subunit MlaD
MTRVIGVLSIILLFGNLAWSQDWEAAFEELENECSERITSLQTTTDSLKGAVLAKQDAIDNANILIENLTKHQDVSRSLVIKYDEMVTISDSTTSLLHKNQELLTASVKDLEDFSDMLHKEYVKVVKKYARRLFARWELYAGLVAGIVLGTLLP